VNNSHTVIDRNSATEDYSLYKITLNENTLRYIKYLY